jgi:hypothetical protein
LAGATEKRAHKATLCARIYFDVNFGEGAATTSIQVDLLLLFPRHCANSHTLACPHKRERNYNMAKLISCTLSLEQSHKSLFFFIQIYIIFMPRRCCCILSCSRHFYSPREETRASQLLFTALLHQVISIQYFAKSWLAVIKNNAKAPSSLKITVRV